MDEGKIDPTNIQIRPFEDISALKTFHSGNRDLDNFIRTSEVHDYEREMYGKTSLVYYDGKLAAYFTLATTVLRNEWLRTPVKGPREQIVRPIPSLLLGRLAVQEDLQKKGLGTYILKLIVGKAIKLSETVGVRLVVLTAYPDNISWYGNRGFHMCVDKHLKISSKESRTKPFMYLDLKLIKETTSTGKDPSANKTPPSNPTPLQ